MVYPGITVALEKGIGKIVGPDLDSIGGRFLVSNYVAKASWIDANPEKAARFVAAMHKATQFILEKPEEALPIIAKETRLDPALAGKFFPERYVAATSVPASEIQNVIDFLVREKFLEKAFPYQEVVSKYLPLVK
jgi:ABC-type nitrate/sulfonate/bicarbonate transport system substrate-binding protein